MCKTDKEAYEKYWDDISPFIKFGCLKDEKFCDKINDYILFKDINDKYQTLPELLAPVADDGKQMQKVLMLLMIQKKLKILMQMQTAQPTLMKTRNLRKIQFTMSQM